MAVQTPPAVLEAFGDPLIHDRARYWYELDLTVHELSETVEYINAAMRSTRQSLN